MNLIDVTLRESVYYGKGLSNEEGLRYLSEMKKNISNKYVQYVEIGYINNDVEAPLNYSADYINQAAEICKDTFKVVAMMHMPKSDLTKWDPEVISRIDLVRVVAGQNIKPELRDYVEYFHSLGVKVSVNVTYVAGLTDEKIIEEIEKARSMGIDYFYCADSSGSFTTKSVDRICRLMLDHCQDMIPGLHLHDHMQMALANALEAQDCGIHMTDVSITGAGKGGGNLKTEQAVLTLYGPEAVNYETLNGLRQMMLFFSDLIGQDGNLFVENLIAFLTGVYRLNLKDTDALEKDSQMDPDKYMRLVSERYTPFAAE